MKACVLAGGGSRGAFQVGVLKQLHRRHKFDAFCGTSIGAFNALFAAQARLPELEKLWRGIRSSSDVYVSRWFAVPLMLLKLQWGYPSLFKAGKMRRIISKRVRTKKVDYAAKLRVGAVNLVTGRYVSVNEGHPLLERMIGASMSVPIAFPPVKIKHKDRDIAGIYVDGSIRNLSPIAEAVSLGATEIHLILTNGSDLSKQRNKSYRDIQELVSRVVDIPLHEILIKDIKEVLVRNMLAAYQERDESWESTTGENLVTAPNQFPRYKHIQLYVYDLMRVLPNGATLPALLDFEPDAIEACIKYGEAAADQPIALDELHEMFIGDDHKQFKRHLPVTV